jgi:uncharacterized protein YndB with AHSA1/START domain
MALSAAAVFALVYTAANAQTDTSATTDKTMAQSTETKHTGSGKNTKTQGKTVTGTVKEYDAGKKLVVTGPKNKDYSFDLDDKNMTANVDPAVAVGNKVTVKEHTDAEGKETMTVSPYKAGSTMQHKSSKTMESAPSTK